jgi:hypothetical protein
VSVISLDFDKDIPVVVPDDVVQWRLEADIDSLVFIHLARGDGTFEVRYIDKCNNTYVPSHLVQVEKQGGDGSTVFIEWEKDYFDGE